MAAGLVLIAASPAAASPARPGGAPKRPDVTCAACYLIDDSGDPLFARAPNRELPNASTTKMVTALIVLRSVADLDAEVAVSEGAAATGGGGLDLSPGESFSVHELLYGLLLSSSNDAAVALAEFVAGTEPAFVAKMNSFALRLGASHTHFVTAHGLDRPDHYSSAGDLALFGARLLRSKALAEIVSSHNAVIDEAAGERHELENTNLLLESYPQTVGIKTGFTAGAGDMLVAANERGGRRLIAVAMGSTAAAADAISLFEYGWERLARTPLLRAGEVVAGVVVDGGGATPVVAAGTVRGLAPPEAVVVSFEAGEVGGRARAGETVGTVTVRAEGRVLGTVPAVAARPVAVEDPPWLATALAGLLRGAAALFRMTA